MASQTDQVSISRLSRRLLIGVGLGFAAIMLALVAVGLSLTQSHQAIERDLELIATVEEPESAAAYEMEINILGAGLAVKKYVLTGDPKHRERLAKDEADFERYRAEYERLSDNPAEKELGRTIDALHKSYRETGRLLLDLRDRREALHARLSAEIEAFDRLFASADFKSPDYDEKHRETLGAAADVGEMGTWIGHYLASSRDDSRQRAFDDLGRVEAHVMTLRRLRLSPEEVALATRVDESVRQISSDLHEVVQVQESLRENQKRFTRLRNELDEVLDEDVQPRTQRDLLAAQQDARANLARSRSVSMALIAASAFVAVAVAVMIARQSAKLGTTSADELRAAMRDLQASKRRRGALLRRLVSAQEEERGRIARELHDQLGQDIFALSLGLAALRRPPTGATSDDATRQNEIQKLQDHTNRLLDEVHNVAWKLRPALLDDLGLHGALSNLVETWARHSGVSIDMFCDLKDRRLPWEVETTLYRVVQEALTNISKHAGAKSASVVLKPTSEHMRLVIEDDGCGFNPRRDLEEGTSDGRLGLLGMKERIEHVQGTLEIDSSPKEGTTIIVSIPMSADVSMGGVA